MNNFGFWFFSVFLVYGLVADSFGGFSMIKELHGVIYVGGKNSLSAYQSDGKNLNHIVTERYSWPVSIMNGSDIGFSSAIKRWPMNLKNINTSLIFDACLNWKEEHQNASVRSNFLDYHHSEYHTPSGDWLSMNYSCMNSFIKSVEEFTNETLWVCGTFGAFPRAFTVNKNNLTFIKFVDANMMTCARYEDEPMATYKDSLNNSYVASGWGLYRPDKKDPDVPGNNSTMLYADWRLYRNLFTLPSSMAWVLSSDVNFINVVKETETHLYFFGHEINNQYGLNNQEDRNAWQSFMLRICKTDLGFKYVPNENKSYLAGITNSKYYQYKEETHDYSISLLHDIAMSEAWYRDTVHLPTKHFLNPLKMNFGCYLGRRPRAISDNHYWGETNVVYINKLADVVFNPQRKINLQTKHYNDLFGCTNETHSQIPLIGVFNSPGLFETQMKPVGALCQLQINANLFHEIGSFKIPYHKHNLLNVNNAYEEIMALSSTSVSNFYSRTFHRSNGFSFDPYWNQGVLIGTRDSSFINWFDEVGKCHNQTFYDRITKDHFLQFQKFSNTAWPSELPNRLTSMTSAVCQYSAVELYSFNATFLVSGEEFKKIYILQENFTNYHMNKLLNEDDEQLLVRLQNSPLMIVAILSNSGILYRVVLCDFDSAMEIHKNNGTESEWYDWCIFRHTDQPYLYRNYEPMEKKGYGESYQYRASSLLMEQKLVKKGDSINFPNNRDPQLDIVKDVLKQGDILHVVTGANIYSIDLKIQCTAYHRCVDCASDPICMWDISTGNCIDYNRDKFKDSLFIQDVLDRGFQCISAIKPKHTTIKSSNILLLNCSNIGFWRDDIKWTMKGEEILMNGDKDLHVFQDKKMLMISNYSVDKHGNKITCYGVQNDYDKLFGGMEYSWIKRSSEMLLDNYEIKQEIVLKSRSPWQGVSIFFILASICLCIGIILQFFKQKINNKVIQSRTNINEPQNKSPPPSDTDLKLLPI